MAESLFHGESDDDEDNSLGPDTDLARQVHDVIQEQLFDSFPLVAGDVTEGKPERVISVINIPRLSRHYPVLAGQSCHLGIEHIGL